VRVRAVVVCACLRWRWCVCVCVWWVGGWVGEGRGTLPTVDGRHKDDPTVGVRTATPLTLGLCTRGIRTA